jgi:O-methyltransferase involved in polyketide biosynthesis
MTNQDSKTATDKLYGAQETLLIPLWARAVEASRPDPILHDAKAVEIIASLDYDFGKFAGGRASQTSCCLRAAITDGWVRQFLQEHPDGTVVEIGAGLDTRFERLDNGRVRWFDLDLPEAMEVRRRFFAESDRRKFLAQSVFDTDWIDVVRRASPGAAMFIGEGVLYYFDESRIKELFALLAKHFPGCLVAFDSHTPVSLAYSNRCDPIRRMRARMVWAIRDIEEIATWAPGYKVVESVPLWDAPEYAKYARRLPWTLRLVNAIWPPSRRMFRIDLVRLG